MGERERISQFQKRFTDYFKCPYASECVSGSKMSSQCGSVLRVAD